MWRVYMALDKRGYQVKKKLILILHLKYELISK